MTSNSCSVSSLHNLEYWSPSFSRSCGVYNPSLLKTFLRLSPSRNITLCFLAFSILCNSLATVVLPEPESPVIQYKTPISHPFPGYQQLAYGINNVLLLFYTHPRPDGNIHELAEYLTSNGKIIYRIAKAFLVVRLDMHRRKRQPGIDILKLKFSHQPIPKTRVYPDGIHIPAMAVYISWNKRRNYAIYI